MAKYKVVIVPKIHEDGIKLLEPIAEVVITEKYESEDALIELCRDADAVIITRGMIPFTRRAIEASPKLKIIARVGVGYDNVDVEAATEHGIWVTIAPVNAPSVAEHAIALLLALSKKLLLRDKRIRDGTWYYERRDPTELMGVDVYGKTLGVIGLGRVGKEVAIRAKCFGMRVVYYSITRKEDLEKSLGLEYKPLDELLKESDFVSLHVPLTRGTYHMIGERELKLMKNTAYLINMARGAVVDTNALIKALKEGWIAGAALDVFEEEPLPPNHPLTKLDNVILTPHVADYTYDCTRRLAITAAEEVLRVLRGDKPLYRVNLKYIKPKSI